MGRTVQSLNIFHILLLAVASIAVLQTSASDTETRLLEIHRYFQNTTTYRQFVCSKPEQECFKENKLLYEGDGRCYSPGERGPCAEGHMFRADKAEAFRRGGHLRGTCDSPCPGVELAPVAATGQCMSRNDVQTKICRADLYLRPAMDVFGQWVCEWTTLVCKPQSNVFGGYPGQYSTYTGICSAPAIFRTLIDGGQNATVPAEKPVDHPLLEYFFNETILQGEYLCTEDEKRCLKYGRLLGNDGKCHVLNRFSARCEPTESFHLNINEALKPQGGRLIGTCRSQCKDFKHPHIKTGACVNYMEFSNQMCRYDWGMQPQVDVFGRMGCMCAWSHFNPFETPQSLPPPATTPGHCKAPDFQNPISAPRYDTTLTLGFQGPCSEDEFACFQEGKVLAMGACHALRTRGPCAQGEELILDKEALAHARIQPKCAPSPCPEGSLPMPIDSTCLTHQEVVALLCPGEHVALDEFGGWQCDFMADNWPGNLTKVVRHSSDGTCELLEKYAHFGIGFAAGSSGGPPPSPGASRPQGGFQGGPGGFQGGPGGSQGGPGGFQGGPGGSQGGPGGFQGGQGSFLRF